MSRDSHTTRNDRSTMSDRKTASTITDTELDALHEQSEAWRRKAISRALRISKLTGSIQAVTDLANEEITARTGWGDGYRAALADLREVLREFGHLDEPKEG